MHRDIADALGDSIRLGITVEEDNPSESIIRPGQLTEAQITWLGSWLAGEGWHK